MEENQESKNSRGGYRPGSGNKYKWKHGETKPVRIPIAIADEIVELAKTIDAGRPLPDSVTQSSATRGGDELNKLQTEIESLRALNSKLSNQVGELETNLIKAYQQLGQTSKERDEYFDRISDIELELQNLKDDHVTQSREDDNVTQSKLEILDNSEESAVADQKQQASALELLNRFLVDTKDKKTGRPILEAFDKGSRDYSRLKQFKEWLEGRR